jgi:hypothetical protein
MDSAYAAGNSLWFDLPAQQRFSVEDAEFRKWLATSCHLGARHEFINGEQKIGFVQLIPGPDLEP